MEPRPAPPESNKRPRSPSGSADLAPIASKVPKTHANHLQINYLARQYPDNIPLVSAEDTLPSILRLISDYDGVLHRHESIAGNLGASPLGPILIKRFERLFDAPPRVLKSHGKEGPNVTWLDIVEFAKNKPEQFNLEKTRNGVRVCQFYTKQSRVEISEEDFILIKSGMPQKMIPPQPIIEDEEKELGALEILEKNLGQIFHLADQVSARARQLNHRLKNRKNAILTRREQEAAMGGPQPQPQGSASPSWRDAGGGLVINTTTSNNPIANGRSRPHSPASGFVAVNTRYPETTERAEDSASQYMFSHPNTDNVTIINGQSIKGASPTTRAELMKKFFTTADRHARGYVPEDDHSGASSGRHSSRPRPRQSDPSEYSTIYGAGAGAVPIPNTPTALLPQSKSVSHYERDDGGPFKMEMIARMENLQRGERVLPPCDRCRRLHMDCLKNLTACMGCTKKHAKCSWKDVKQEELLETQNPDASQEHHEVTIPAREEHHIPPINPSESAPASANPANRRASEPQPPTREAPPKRSASEHDPASQLAGQSKSGRDDTDDDDQGTNDLLVKAIMDTVDHHYSKAALSEKDKEGNGNGNGNASGGAERTMTKA
ncbi:hypothetical protein FQN54_001178 [Arachnomyces sp. PD_36]|nr:hypothetical protein FQN54_001178 [Arachnomyces sp. PD_36]